MTPDAQTILLATNRSWRCLVPSPLPCHSRRRTIKQLHILIRAHKTPQYLEFSGADHSPVGRGAHGPKVARRLGTTRATVRRWRRRHWLTRQGCTLPERLPDMAQPGAPATFSAAQWCQIIRACSVSGRSHASQRVPLQPETCHLDEPN